MSLNKGAADINKCLLTLFFSLIYLLLSEDSCLKEGD